ncbi:helix-turn-helix domain-containing protein [Halobacteria archaeon HArc-gm2]|nr:helix-turn-helix domain-containing protein [Halobacteria archaeon HArc-gm2]
MSFVVELTIRDPPLFAGVFGAVPDTTATIESYHHFSDGPNEHYTFFWWVEGSDFAEFERHIREYRYVCELRELATVGERRLYRLTTNSLSENVMLSPHFRRHDVSMLDNEGSVEGFWLRLRVPDRETLRTVVGELRAMDTDPFVDRIYSEQVAGRGTEDLTDRQRECLSLASERGYFETPSEATLGELAGDLDVTPQALSKHIRAAVRKLVERELSAGHDPTHST